MSKQNNDVEKMRPVPPFVRFVAAAVPMVFDDSLSYYEALCALWKYIDETVQVINNNAAVTEDFINQFKTLKSYVDNYFNNLDVQEEINNKLDDMTRDGSLGQLIDSLLTPYIDEINNNLNERLNTQDITIANNTARINSLASGSPLVASSVSQMTDTSRTYVNTSDGNWYYYNNGSWLIGGAYQAVRMDSGAVHYYTLNDDIVGNRYKQEVTSAYPTILFSLLNTVEASSDSPVNIKIKFKLKYESTPANFTVLNRYGLVNNTNHTISSTYHVNTGKNASTFWYEDVIINEGQFTHNFNYFTVSMNTSNSVTSVFEVSDIEIYVNNQKQHFIFDNLFEVNSTVTVSNPKIGYLATKDYVDTALDNRKVLRENIDESLFSKSYKFNGIGSYVGIRLNLNKSYSGNNSVKVKFKNNVISDFQTIPIMVGISDVDVISNQVKTNYQSNTGYNLTSDNVNKVITYTYNATNQFNHVRLYMNQVNDTKYNFIFENLTVYINDEEVDYELNTDISTEGFEEITQSNVNGLATLEYVDNLVFDNETIQYYDSAVKSNKYNISCWGDSLTEGGTAEGQPYPTVLNQLLGEKYIVNNFGKSGQRSGAIAFRQGGNVFTLTNAVTIPASNDTAVQVTFNISHGDWQNIGVVTLDANIGGVVGKLQTSGAEDGVISGTFTRNESGSQTTVPSGTVINSLQNNHTEDMTIIWMGINDITFGWPFQSTGTGDNYVGMINYLTPNVKRFLCVSTCTTASMTPESQLYAQVVALNNIYKALTPNNWIDLNKYASSQLIYDMGLTPTQQDLANMANGIIPPSVTADNTHFTGEARVYIARFIYNELAKRGWI